MAAAAAEQTEGELWGDLIIKKKYDPRNDGSQMPTNEYFLLTIYIFYAVHHVQHDFCYFQSEPV